MSVASARIPPGYVALSATGVDGVALATLAATLGEALREGSFYAYAEHHPAARALVGRGVVYAVPLPDGVTPVVVRRSRHGGMLAPLTGEHFLGNGRAPRELAVSLRLRRLGIATPEIVAWATYPAGAVVRRADVVTREVDGARDFATALLDADFAERRAMLQAAAELLAAMTAVGARHPDLNLRNVLLARDENGALAAHLLDVDRVWFDRAGARVTAANLRRFARSARKWRRQTALPLDDSELAWLAVTVAELAASSVP